MAFLHSVFHHLNAIYKEVKFKKNRFDLAFNFKNLRIYQRIVEAWYNFNSSQVTLFPNFSFKGPNEVPS